MRDAMLYDPNHTLGGKKETVFHKAINFLRYFCVRLPQYRSTFVTSGSFDFLCKVIPNEDVGISDLFCDIYKENLEAYTQVSLPFVDRMLAILLENLTMRPFIALNILRVLISMVTSEEDTLNQFDNGNMITLQFLGVNSKIINENPFIPMTYDGYGVMQSYVKADNNRINSYLEQLAEAEAQKKLADQRARTRMLESKVNIDLEY